MRGKQEAETRGVEEGGRRTEETGDFDTLNWPLSILSFGPTLNNQDDVPSSSQIVRLERGYG